jgi:hypothetical protein
MLIKKYLIYIEYNTSSALTVRETTSLLLQTVLLGFFTSFSTMHSSLDDLDMIVPQDVANKLACKNKCKAKALPLIFLRSWKQFPAKFAGP